MSCMGWHSSAAGKWARQTPHAARGTKQHLTGWGGHAQGAKKKGAAPGPSAVLVLGTASGDVKAFDTQRSELAWRSKSAVEG